MAYTKARLLRKHDCRQTKPRPCDGRNFGGGVGEAPGAVAPVRWLERCASRNAYFLTGLSSADAAPSFCISRPSFSISTKRALTDAARTSIALDICRCSHGVRVQRLMVRTHCDCIVVSGDAIGRAGQGSDRAAVDRQRTTSPRQNITKDRKHD